MRCLVTAQIYRIFMCIFTANSVALASSAYFSHLFFIFLALSQFSVLASSLISISHKAIRSLYQIRRSFPIEKFHGQNHVDSIRFCVTKTPHALFFRHWLHQICLHNRCSDHQTRLLFVIFFNILHSIAYFGSFFAPEKWATGHWRYWTESQPV